MQAQLSWDRRQRWGSGGVTSPRGQPGQRHHEWHVPLTHPLTSPRFHRDTRLSRFPHPRLTGERPSLRHVPWAREAAHPNPETPTCRGGHEARQSCRVPAWPWGHHGPRAAVCLPGLSRPVGGKTPHSAHHPNYRLACQPGLAASFDVLCGMGGAVWLSTLCTCMSPPWLGIAVAQPGITVLAQGPNTDAHPLPSSHAPSPSGTRNWKFWCWDGRFPAGPGSALCGWETLGTRGHTSPWYRAWL